MYYCTRLCCMHVVYFVFLKTKLMHVNTNVNTYFNSFQLFLFLFCFLQTPLFICLFVEILNCMFNVVLHTKISSLWRSLLSVHIIINSNTLPPSSSRLSQHTPTCLVSSGCIRIILLTCMIVFLHFEFSLSACNARGCFPF